MQVYSTNCPALQDLQDTSVIFFSNYCLGFATSFLLNLPTMDKKAVPLEGYRMFFISFVHHWWFGVILPLSLTPIAFVTEKLPPHDTPGGQMCMDVYTTDVCAACFAAAFLIVFNWTSIKQCSELSLKSL